MKAIREHRHREAARSSRLRERWRAVAIRVRAVFAAAVGAGVLSLVALVGASASATRPRARVGAAPAPGARAQQPFAIGVRALRLVDRSRTIELGHGRAVPRTLVTSVRYPAAVGGAASDRPGAPPAVTSAPYPLIVFAHGYDVTPAIYARLLDSWVGAGYVVAAPLFPRESPGAPGGPDRSDLVNEPTDVSFVISRLLAESANPRSPLYSLIDAHRVAVAGHSDGAEVALAAAYSRRYADPRVHAAIVLSGAEMSAVGGFPFHRGDPALLAAQGTADTTNEPRFTYAFFSRASGPKFLLRLIGAGHLPPYTGQEPQLRVVEHVTRAFLDAYLKGARAGPTALVAAGDVPQVASLTAAP
jgi:hypothetical protein